MLPAGVSDVTFEELQEWGGYHLVSNHAAMKGAVKGMMEYLSINFANKSTVHSENDEFYGMGRIFHPFKFEEWIARHEQYQEYEKNLKRKKIVIGVRAAMGGPGIGAQGGPFNLGSAAIDCAIS